MKSLKTLLLGKEVFCGDEKKKSVFVMKSWRIGTV